MRIVYFAPIAFDDLKQRSQYMAEYLARKHQVLYVEPTLKWLSHVRNRQIEYLKVNRKVKSHLSVIRCDGRFTLPFQLNLFDFMGLNGLGEAFQLKKMIQSADVVIVGFEGWYQVLRWFRIPCLVYDKMDDNALLVKNALDKRYLLRAEKHILQRADAVIVTAEVFFDRYKASGKKIELIPNGVELPGAEQIKENKYEKKIYGYVGLISSWFDMDIVNQIADDANVEVWLVGPCNIPAIMKENVKYIGKVPKNQVAEYINCFDVCLYPFKRGALADTVNPVKIYEYLAMNKPVIAVDSIETKKFGSLVYRYKTKSDVEKLCGHDLRRPFRDEAERLEFIRKNSWEARMKNLDHVLEGVVRK